MKGKMSHVSFVITLFQTVFLANEGNLCNGQSVTSFRMDYLQLPCNTSFTQSSMWIKNEEMYLFAAGDPVAKLDDKVRLNSSNYALIFNGVGLKDEGNYTCKVGGSVVSTYFLKVHVTPNLEISLDGTIAGDVTSVEFGHVYMLACSAKGSKPMSNLVWSINGVQSVANTNNFSYLRENGTFNSESNLLLTVKDQSTIVECMTQESFKNGQFVSLSIELKSNGHPNVSLTFQNGNIIEGSVYALHDSHHVITCTAEGLGITKTSLETRSMFTLWEKSRDGTNIVSNEVTSNGSQVIINLHATAVLTLIECNVFGDFSVLTVSRAEILTVVVPNVTMTIKSRPIWTVIEMQRSRTYTLSCHAIGARPAVKLYWLVDGSLTFIAENHFKSKSNERNTGLLDKRSDIQISLDGPKGRISCVCEGNTSLQSKVVTADIVTDENESASTTVNAMPFLFTIITIVCIVVVAVVIYIFRNHATPLNLRSRQVLRGEVGTINKSGTKDDIQKDQDSHSLKDSEEGVRHQHGQQQRKHEKVQSMVLPAIPQEAAETIQVYYSRPKDSLQMTRIFTKREVCFVAQLKKGLFLTRWLGTIEESKGKKKCVYVSILNEDKDMKTEFQWDVFLQKLMELPKHMNVVEAEGILTDRENIYLLQEYIPVGSLHENLVIHGHDYRGINAEFASSELFDIGLQILKGMEFIVTYGFLHPGISTRRILFTENGCCKLYDFCLKEDARKHVICIKGKDIRSPLPPEAEARNEYTWASDSWSVAMCVLKLMTFDISGTEEAMAPETLIQCPSYVQNCFKNCQSENPHDRPPLSDLRQALLNWKEEVQLLTSHVEAIGVTTSSKGRQDDDGYIIMEGNVRSEEN
ncbi:uncharacterized protein [Apostichopus japonicus]|uniref:uncharacterized protein isoform X2 n=1 Tax=Stichopus japonicus TaxID=307972 RepID=UPI003AB51676